MKMVVHHIKWIMLVSGVLTMTSLYAAIAPTAALQTTFGESLSGPLAELIVRNWGVLVGVTGVMLVYGGFESSARTIALMAACLSKTAFVALVVSNGGRYLAHGAGTAVAVDSLMVVLFVAYLARRPTPASV